MLLCKLQHKKCVAKFFEWPIDNFHFYLIPLVWEFTKLLTEICKIFSCFYKVIYDFFSSLHQPFMTYASKTTFCLNNVKILRPKVRKNLTNLHKKFCEFPHRCFVHKAQKIL